MKKSLLALSLALLFSGASYAKSPDWNLVELSYIKADIDDSDIEPDGFGLMGSVLVSDNVFLFADYAVLDEEVFGVDVDLDTLSAGVGYRYGLSNTTDVFAALSFEYIDASAAGTSDSENGYGLTAGVRSMLTDKFELGGSVDYVDIDSDDDTSLNIFGRYYFTDNLAAGLNYGISDDVDQYSVSLRYAF